VTCGLLDSPRPIFASSEAVMAPPGNINFAAVLSITGLIVFGTITSLFAKIGACRASKLVCLSVRASAACCHGPACAVCRRLCVRACGSV